MIKQFADLAISATGTISDDAVLHLRGEVWADGAISETVAHAILDVNARVTSPSRQWTDFLVEAISVWLVEEQDPRGYVDAAQSTWLIAALSREGRGATIADIELLARVLERAVSVPSAIESFVLKQIEAIICSRAAPAGVTADDARLLRRVLFAPSSDRTDGISQGEAELLFRLKDATLDRDNAPEWQELFVQGVANFLQGFSVTAPLDRSREADLEAFMSRPEKISDFLGRARHIGGIAENLRALRHIGWHEHQFADDAEQAASAKVMTPQKDAWLSTQIGGDDRTDVYEQALLSFLAQD